MLVICTYCRFRGEKYISSHGGSGGSLVLKRAKLEDGGQYHCKVTNPQGGSADSDTVTITVGEQSFVQYVYTLYIV